MRARHPDVNGHITRDGVRLGYEVHGDGEPAVLLLPTWTIIHSRFWKMQVPYLARYHKVITYDGPGNGQSDRVTDPGRYTPDEYAHDAVAVLDACGVDRAVVVGLSLGAQYGVSLAVNHPNRVAGLAMIGAALRLTPPSPERADIIDTMWEPYPDDVAGWGKYNVAYWHDHYPDFLEFFFRQCFSEPHSTKPIEDAVGWGLETSPDVLEAESLQKGQETDWAELLGRVRCPTLVIHGTNDRIHPHERGVVAAQLTDGVLLSMEGSGHIPNVRDPVRVNLALREFIAMVPG